jgi:hypothetical protein
MILVQNMPLGKANPFDLAVMFHHQIRCHSTFAFNKSAKPNACSIEM